MRTLRRPFCLAIAAVVSLSLGQTSDAALTEFFGQDDFPGNTVPAGGNAETARNAFLSNLSGVGTEDFEGITTGTTSPIALTFPGTSGSITATLSGGGAIIRSGPNGFGRFATSGTKYVDTNSGGDFVIDFSSAISAFGFYGTDIGEFGGDLILTLTNGTTQTLTLDTSGSTEANLLFYGFIDTTNAYTRIAFNNTSGSDAFGFDDLTIGDRSQVVIPEPSSLALYGIGLLAAGGATRLRKRRS